MAVILLSLPRPGDWSELSAPREDSRGASRCPGETRGQTVCCVQSSLWRWMWPGPWEGHKGMRVGKQSRAPALPWISGRIAAQGGQGTAQRDWGLLGLTQPLPGHRSNSPGSSFPLLEEAGRHS